MLRLEKRPSPSGFWRWAAPLVAVLLTMVLGGLLFSALGKDPVEAMRTIFYEPLFGQYSSFSRPQLLVKAGPLILIAVGLSFGFRAGIWNIGAEGQYIIGAICGAGFALAFYPSEARWFIFPGAVICGMLGGMAWGLIPGWLRTRFGTNEILTSLMLVYVAENILAKMAIGLLKNPDGLGFPGSRNLKQYPAAHNPELIAGTGAHWGVFAAALAVLVAWLLLSRHQFGFNVQLSGLSPKAARFAGVNPNRLILSCMAISGALAGLAGYFEVSGPSGQISIDFNVGYGFTAIIVAYLGRLHPVGILFAGLLLALTYIGGEVAALTLNLPIATIQMFQGMLLFSLLMVDTLTDYRIRFGGRKVV